MLFLDSAALLSIPPALLCTLCWINQYISGTKVPKKVPATAFRYLIAFWFGGLRERHPIVHGRVATRYEIMNISCQSWSSVEVTYVHPPQVKVLKMPIPTTNLDNAVFGLGARRYHIRTRANRGPEVTAMKSWNTERSGYRSPIVADTEGNHSSGNP